MPLARRRGPRLGDSSGLTIFAQAAWALGLRCRPVIGKKTGYNKRVIKELSMSNTENNKSAPTEIVPAVPAHNQHHVLDTIETAALDEVQHEAALRDSALRVPR